MSRIAKKSIFIPEDVKIILKKNIIVVIGKKGELSRKINNFVKITYEVKKKLLHFSVLNNIPKFWMYAGTFRSLINSMIIGVTIGFSKKLKLIGVGYRASINNLNILILSLGYSHDIKYKLPKNIFIKINNQTEIIISGIDKQLIGQVASKIRNFRKPDSYKGKGVRYFDEVIKVKEAKKK